MDNAFLDNQIKQLSDLPVRRLGFLGTQAEDYVRAVG